MWQVHRIMNRNLKRFKASLLNRLSHYIDPILWQEFVESKKENTYYFYNGYYVFYENDLPNFRDLKAFLNWITALEKATESYSFVTLSVLYTLKLPVDAYYFYSNFKIFITTDSLTMQYIISLKNQFTTQVYPALMDKFRFLYSLCTNENAEKSVDFFVDQIIKLEHFQQDYQNKLKMLEEKKTETNMNSLLLQWDTEIQKYKFVGENYSRYILMENKKELLPLDKPKIIDFSVENTTDTDTIKNIKRLRNCIVAIAKFTDDYALSSKENRVLSTLWIPTLFNHAKIAWRNLQAFKYKEIIAEKSLPLANYIKELFKGLNISLEKLACIIDEIENDQCLRENTLLKWINPLIQRHNQITKELDIPMDYTRQIHVFAAARIEGRNKQIDFIHAQILELETILPSTKVPLTFISQELLQKIQVVIDKHSNLDVSKADLIKYKNYLLLAPSQQTGLKIFFMSSCEKRVMQALRRKYLSLQKQEAFLIARLNSLQLTFKNYLYHFCDIKDIIDIETMMPIVMNKHIMYLRDIKNTLVSQSQKISSEESKDEKKSKPISNKLIRKINFALEEYGLFNEAARNYNKKEDFPLFFSKLKSNEKSLSYSTLQLVHQMNAHIQKEKIPNSSCSSASLTAAGMPKI